MKKLAIASLIAVTASLSLGTLAQAETTVKIGPGGARVVEHHRHYVPHHRHCYTKKVVSYHHGRKVVKTQRVCR